MSIPADIVSLDDYERHARSRLPEATLAYVGGGAAGETTLRRNRDAFAARRLYARGLADFRNASARLRLFGLSLEAPIVVAPMALQRLAHPEGEIAMATGARAAGCGMTVSCEASVDFARIAAAAPESLWLQLYLQPRRADTLTLLRRAEDCGYRAVVLTIDAPVNGVRDAERRAGFTPPPGVSAVNLAGFRQATAARVAPARSPVFRGLLDGAPCWDDVAWLRDQTRLPLLLKGVTHPDDAERALALGADGLIVSNHGGRTLDMQPAAIDLLPAIARRVAGRVPLLADGGVRRGTDALCALALGASAVMVGRPLFWALAVGGAAGVAHALALLATELEAAMALTGRPTLADIDDSIFVPDAPADACGRAAAAPATRTRRQPAAAARAPRRLSRLAPIPTPESLDP
ncbi:alpha-hydroxy acid oxidase [Camelimonas abortus]|uniref:Alpha-hydroxy acid oxidase n=1 Tax=Camelimonas abortus TaxID=1017184 RepID=A0ABV7LBV0_9HYPH